MDTKRQKTKEERPKKESFFKSRKFRYGGFATAFTVLFIVVVVLLNFMVNALGNAVDLTFDITSEGTFQITQDSLDYLSSLDTPVELIVLSDREETINYGKYLAQAINVLEDYAKHSDNITVRYVDLYKNPTFTSQYADMSLTQYDVLVKSDLRSTKFSLLSLYGYGEDGSIMSYAEQIMTSSIIQVASKELPKVGIITGFGENEIDGFESILTANAFEVFDVALMTEDIDPDTEILILSAPTRDLREEDLKKLDDFLYNNGEFGKNLFYIADATQPELPNLEAFLAEWGIGIQTGLVYETDMNRMVTQDVSYVVPNYKDDVFAKTVQANNLFMVMPYSRYMTQLFETNENTTTELLLEFASSVGVLKPDVDTEEFDWQNPEITGPTAALIRAKRGQSASSETVSSVFAVASYDSFNSQYLNSSTLGNGLYWLGAFNQLTPNENSVEILPVSVLNYLGMSSQTALIFAIIFIGVLPVVILGIGITVWLRRRHL